MVTNARVWFLRLTALASFASAAVFIGAAESQPALTPMQREYLKKLEGPIILRGDYFKAVSVAYSDFEKELSKNADAARAPDAPNKALLDWTSKIENYDIHIAKKGELISVDFIPTVRGNFMPVLGGGGHHDVSGSSFQIESKLLSK